MRKLLQTIIVLASISIASVANAGDPLLDSVVKVFKSDTSTIKYDFTSVANSSPYSVRGTSKQTVNYLLKNGEKELTVGEHSNNGKLYATTFNLHLDGFLYTFGIANDSFDLDVNKWSKISARAYVESDEARALAIKQQLDASKKINKLSDEDVKFSSVAATDSVYDMMLKNLKYYFLPLLPDENRIIIDGHEVLQNPCIEFSSSGTEMIQGKNLQYIEYKTSPTYPITMTARYYFDNGRLAKYVDITKNGELDISPELQAAYGNRILTKVGGYTIINVYEFTTDVNDIFFTLPENVKVDKKAISKRG